CLQGYNNPYNF
nr:immunoglobulin light chain junction region [Macaca mulatta]